jgi:hypothetical protein
MGKAIASTTRTSKVAFTEVVEKISFCATDLESASLLSSSAMGFQTARMGRTKIAVSWGSFEFQNHASNFFFTFAYRRLALAHECLYDGRYTTHLLDGNA